MSAIEVSKSVVSFVQDVPVESQGSLASSARLSDDINTKKKCFRKGSRICYTDLENVTVLQKIPEKQVSRISLIDNVEDKVYEKVDSYRSGESLFKTFTFEQTRDIDDPETVKCIEFWKSVMQKNLAPIKCTLLECNKKCSPKAGKRTPISKKQSTEPKQSVELPKKQDTAQEVRKIWSEALKEIKKRKLDQLKLYVRERCEYCRDPFAKQLRDGLGTVSKEEDTRNIESLNDWKPAQPSEPDPNRKQPFKQRLSMKLQRLAGPKTNELKTKEPSTVSHHSVQKRSSSLANEVKMKEASLVRNQSSAKSSWSIKKDPSSVKQPFSAVTFSPVKNISVPQLMSVDIQAPEVKCACSSDTCICPHRAATRNSKTSFVEIARMSMPRDDRSTEKIAPEYGDTCVCSASRKPWDIVICNTDPCPELTPKVTVLESSSDLDLTQVTEKEVKCTCRTKHSDECPLDVCASRESYESFESGSTIQNKEYNSCVCGTETVPCRNEVCPTKKLPEKSTECKCDTNFPWIQSTCYSRSCPHPRRKLKKRTDDEEKITLRRSTPTREVTSTCVCNSSFPWKEVICPCEQCTTKLNANDKKNTLKAVSLTLRKPATKSYSKDNLQLTSSKEKIKTKSLDETKPVECLCTTSPPWKSVYCPSKTCETKEVKMKLASESVISDDKSSTDVFQCICKDKTMETTCKAYKCQDRAVSIEYPSPCICPKDAKESEHEHFTCLSKTCRMKKIDKTCICDAQPEATCETDTCPTKPPKSKLLRPEKSLIYDTKCICKCRGLSNTIGASCTAAECPFKIKPRQLPKKEQPKLYVPQSPRSTESTTKCICGRDDPSMPVVCPSPKCRKNKSRSIIQGDDGDFSESDICICKNVEQVQSQQEVTCKNITCLKINVNEGGIAMKDECVCTNMVETCDEPLCHSKMVVDKPVKAIKKEIPFCYICGRYNCSNRTNKTKICSDKFEVNEIVECREN